MHLERPSYTCFLEIARLDRTVWEQNRSSEYIPDGEHILAIVDGVRHCVRCIGRGQHNSRICAFSGKQCKAYDHA